MAAPQKKIARRASFALLPKADQINAARIAARAYMSSEHPDAVEDRHVSEIAFDLGCYSEDARKALREASIEVIGKASELDRLLALHAALQRVGRAHGDIPAYDFHLLWTAAEMAVEPIRHTEAFHEVFGPLERAIERFSTMRGY